MGSLIRSRPDRFWDRTVTWCWRTIARLTPVAYSTLMPVFDTFDGGLQADGELLTLVKPGLYPSNDLVVARVRYDASLPWPTNGTTDRQFGAIGGCRPGQLARGKLGFSGRRRRRYAAMGLCHRYRQRHGQQSHDVSRERRGSLHRRYQDGGGQCAGGRREPGWPTAISNPVGREAGQFPPISRVRH